MVLRAILEDSNAIAHPIRECTSGTRPTTFRKGRVISETDTGLLYVNTGTSSSPSWTPVTSEAAVRASEIQYGSTRLAQAPEVTNEPIAVGENDTRFVATIEHASTEGNPHQTTPGDIGAAVTSDLDVLADAQAAHDADPTKHIVVGTITERDAIADPVDEMLFLDKAGGRFYWWDETGSEWDTAPSAPAPSYFDLADIPDEFDPQPHKADHSVGGPDALSPSDIGAMSQSVTLTAGTGLDTTSVNVADNPTLSLEPVSPDPAGTYSNANITVDSRGRVTVAASGSTSGVPDASEDSAGVVYLSSDPPTGEVPRVVRVGDAVASGFVPTTRLLGASGPLSINSADSADLSVDRTITLDTASLSNAYIITGSSLVRDVANNTARDALTSVKRGQLVYVASSGTLFKNTAANDGDTPIWTDVASGASMATDATAGLTKLSDAPLTAGDPIALTPHSPRFAAFIIGLKVSRPTSTQIKVGLGSAWVPGLNRTLRLSSEVTKTVTGITANTWRYVYLFDNGGTPDIEISTTVPDPTPYAGTARTKTSDTTRRFLFAFLCDAAGTGIYNFTHNPISCLVSYLEPKVLTDSIFWPFIGVTGTTTRTLTVSAVPPGGFVTDAKFHLASWDATQVNWGPVGFTPSPTVGIGYIFGAAASGNYASPLIPMDANRQFVAKGSASTSTMEWYTQGYWFER